MTVEQLIERLKELPQFMDVLIADPECHYVGNLPQNECNAIDRVEVTGACAVIFDGVLE